MDRLSVTDYRYPSIRLKPYRMFKISCAVRSDTGMRLRFLVHQTSLRIDRFCDDGTEEQQRNYLIG